MSSSDKHTIQVIDDVNLPYMTNVNPVTRTEKPYYVSGINVITRASSPVQRRPGFPQYPGNTTDYAPGIIKNLFVWRKWDGTEYLILSITNSGAGNVKVYANGSLIYTASSGALGDFDFVVSNNFLYAANGNFRWKFDGSTVTDWGSPMPTNSIPVLTNAAAGNVPQGRGYVYCFGNSTTGYRTDISLVSYQNTAARQWTVQGFGSDDAQLDKVYIFRQDSDGVFRELSTSPVNITNSVTLWSVTDNDFDSTSVGTPQLKQGSVAPTRGVNGTPPTGIQGLRFFAGRIWGFYDDTVAYSGLEEVNNGVPEESFGTELTNRVKFGERVTGLEVLGSQFEQQQGQGILLVFTESAVHCRTGSSLATFTTGTLMRHRGARSRRAICAGETPELGAFVAWLDVSNAIYMISKEKGFLNVSLDISPDIASIDHFKASLAVHDDGPRRWLVLSDGGASNPFTFESVLRVLDLIDMSWNPPWSMSTLNVGLYSSLLAGVNELFVVRGGRIFHLDNTTFLDGKTDGSTGAPYSASVWVSLMPLSLSRPEQVTVLEYIGVEVSSLSSSIIVVKYVLDDDPTSSPTYTTVAAVLDNPALPFLRNADGANLKERWYYVRDKAGARRVSVRFDWPAENTAFKLFSFSVVSSRQGGS